MTVMQVDRARANSFPGRVRGFFMRPKKSARKISHKDLFTDSMIGCGYRSYMVMPGQPVWMDRNYPQFALEAYIKNVIAHRAIGMVAGAAASVHLKLSAIGPDGLKQEITIHPLLTMLCQPNPTQARGEFFKSLHEYKLISGNAFIQAVGPKGAPPSELHLLRPDRMAVIAGKGTMPAGYRYTVNGQYTDYPVDPFTGRSQILHLKNFHPLNDWYGLSAVEAAAYSIDQHNQSGAWNQALLQNGARPSGALVVRVDSPGGGRLSEDQYNRVKLQIDEQFTGAPNAGRPLLLEGGLDWKEMSLTPKDMDFVEAKNSAARDIALAFGVPPQLLGIPGDNTYSNLQEARLALWEQTVVPLVKVTVDALNSWLLPMFGNNLELCADTDNISALALRNQVIWDRVQKATFLTENEKRAAVGYGPLPTAFKRARRPVRSKRNARLLKDIEIDDGGDDGVDTSYKPHVGRDFGGFDPNDPANYDPGFYETPDNNADNAINPNDLGPEGYSQSPLPLLGALGALSAPEALSALRGMGALGETTLGDGGIPIAEDNVSRAAQSIEDYFGGQPKTFPNDNGDLVMMNDDSKIRFDINDSHGEDPHFHVEQQNADGDWEDAGNNHMYFFKPEE